MAISKQVDSSVCSHVVDHTWHNYAVTTNTSRRSHATKDETPMRFASSKSANNICDAASPPIITHQLKVPVGDGPYVRAKQVQLVERDPERAIALFWAAINAGDRVDSALKDMAVVMKQQNRTEEAIQAILSFRHLCSSLAQESLDNVLLELYKKCGRLDDQIELLKHKLNLIHQGMVFNGKRTKTARSHGKKFQLSIREEATRLLGNLGWSYMKLCNYMAAEAVYRKALSIDADSNKLCNLGVCLLKQRKYEEARVVLEQVIAVSPDGRLNSDLHMKSFERSRALLRELSATQNKQFASVDTNEQGFSTPKEFDLWTHWKLWEPPSAPNSALDIDMREIVDNPAEFSTNLALNHFKISNSNDTAMRKSCKEIAGASRKTDNLHLKMPNFVCNNVDDMLTHTVSPTTPPQRHAGSFKREIGPSSTQQSKAKDNTHGNDKSTGEICNCAKDNHINTIDACWLNDGWVSPAITCQKPVARRLSLDARLVQGVQSKKASICAIGNIIEDELMDASSCTGEGISAVNKDFPISMDTSFNGKAQADAISTTVLDFTCVDKVIESIVPDAPSASQDMENNASSKYANALGNARYHEDQLFAPSKGVHAQNDVESMESLSGVHQYRLRIFQEKTHIAQAVP